MSFKSFSHLLSLGALITTATYAQNPIPADSVSFADWKTRYPTHTWRDYVENRVCSVAQTYTVQNLTAARGDPQLITNAEIKNHHIDASANAFRAIALGSRPENDASCVDIGLLFAQYEDKRTQRYLRVDLNHPLAPFGTTIDSTQSVMNNYRRVIRDLAMRTEGSHAFVFTPDVLKAIEASRMSDQRIARDGRQILDPTKPTESKPISKTTIVKKTVRANKHFVSARTKKSHVHKTKRRPVI